MNNEGFLLSEIQLKSNHLQIFYETDKASGPQYYQSQIKVLYPTLKEALEQQAQLIIAWKMLNKDQ